MRSLWGKHPLIVPRWVLAGIYVGFVILGGVAIAFGSPTLDLTTPSGYAAIWGCIAAVSAIGCFVGSIREAWEPLERWSLVVLMSVVIVYLVSALWLLFVDGGSLSRASFTVIVIMITALPATRAAYLLTRTGIKNE